MAQCYAKCTNCGAVLQVESTMEAAVCPQCSVAFSMNKAIQNYYGTTGNPAEQPKKKKLNLWAIVTVILAVVLIAGGGILLYKTLNNTNNNGGDTTVNNNEGDNNTINNNEGDKNVVNNNVVNNNTNKEQNGTASLVDPDALTGRYVSESGLYEIEFEDDFTCRWYQDVHGNPSYFVGTYEKDGDIYVLYMEGGKYSYNTRFEAEPVEGGFIITGGLVDGEFFEKQ